MLKWNQKGKLIKYVFPKHCKYSLMFCGRSEFRDHRWLVSKPVLCRTHWSKIGAIRSAVSSWIHLLKGERVRPPDETSKYNEIFLKIYKVMHKLTDLVKAQDSLLCVGVVNYILKSLLYHLTLLHVPVHISAWAEIHITFIPSVQLLRWLYASFHWCRWLTKIPVHSTAFVSYCTQFSAIAFSPTRKKQLLHVATFQ